MKIILFSLLCLSVGSLCAQDVLPRGLTDHEKTIMDDYYKHYPNSDRAFTTPPGGSLRNMAEWEEVQALIITWTGQYNDIQTQIVDAAQEECEVVIACSDSSQVKSTLNNNGVPDVNISYIEVPYNSIWIRDYGVNTMYKNDVDSLFLVDWIYNRPRPDDDAMADHHANFFNLPLYTTTSAPTDLVNTGGNWMSDGNGTGFASELILEENEPGNPYNVTVKSENDINGIMGDFMGITKFIKMPVLPYDNIHHIDMHMKLLDEETLLVSKYPTGVADGPQIEANLQYVLTNFNSMFGTPYKVVRITVPPSTGGSYPDNGGYYRTYANNVFINKTILLPVYREQYDTTAIRTLEEALPGYTIVPIDVDNSGQNLISLSGAIHCITHTIGVEDPLLITHQPLENTYDDMNPYLVSAMIRHRTGLASAALFYKTSLSGTYQSVSMTNTGGDTWEASVPTQAVGSKIYYYIHAEANNGKQLNRPIVAPDGYWMFQVLGSVGIEEHVSNGITMMDVFPNPANAITCIPLESLHATEARITLRDVTGKIIEEIHKGSVPMGPSKYFFHADQYAAGSYFVVVETGKSILTKAVLIGK